MKEMKSKKSRFLFLIVFFFFFAFCPFPFHFLVAVEKDGKKRDKIQNEIEKSIMGSKFKQASQE
jgi:hypothetical protein